jgi:hypothetical protein
MSTPPFAARVRHGRGAAAARLRASDLAILIGAAAGLLPAIRAARLSPTQALWSL